MRDLKPSKAVMHQTWEKENLGSVEEEEKKAYLHRENMLKTVHALRPGNRDATRPQLNSIMATSRRSEKLKSDAIEDHKAHQRTVKDLEQVVFLGSQEGLHSAE